MILRTHRNFLYILKIECPLMPFPKILKTKVSDCVQCKFFRGSSYSSKAYIENYMVANPTFIKCSYDEKA